MMMEFVESLSGGDCGGGGEGFGRNVEEDLGGLPLPGFRFHPTDEELVGFYLRRKVEKKMIISRTIDQLIKHEDIYKYDPWDLPKSNTLGDDEWYFFCKRGRKYRNSVRPNRVTGSGFWKATGIDRPVYSAAGGRDCIGLKKSLVFYRGSAGKGTKTDWMMHEFRLPPPKCSKHHVDQDEAEVWTLCRILKRKVSQRKSCIPDWREMACKSKTINSEVSCNKDMSIINCINFSSTEPVVRQNDEKKPYISHINMTSINHPNLGRFFSPSPPISSVAASSYASSVSCIDIDEFSRNGDWEDLWSMVDHSFAAPPVASFSL